MPSAVLQRAIPAYAADALRVLYAHRWLIGYIAFFLLCGLTARHLYDLPDEMSVSFYSPMTFKVTLVFLGVFALLYPFYVMIFVRPARLTRYMIDDLWANYLNAERVLGALILVSLFPMFMSTFTFFKTMIAVTYPHAWDVEFEIWDRWLHAGYHPWQLLQPLLGYPVVTSVINFFYHLWLFVLYGLLMWQSFSTRDPRLRMQFFLTFVLSWSVMGSLLATLFSSGGPVYFGRLTGLADPYVPLMDYLYAAGEQVTVWALNVQDRLWESHMLGKYDFGTGISAMPSMHVSSSVLFALLGWRVNRFMGIVLSAFAVLIMIGSVHLAWHYAIDGYVSIVLTLALWRAAGWWIDRDPAYQGR